MIEEENGENVLNTNPKKRERELERHLAELQRSTAETTSTSTPGGESTPTATATMCGSRDTSGVC